MTASPTRPQNTRKSPLFEILTSLAVATGIFVATPAFAQNLPASQAAVAYGNVAIISAGTNGWQPILAQQIKTPNKKELGMTVSLECGLYTKTNVKSKRGQKETATAEASVKVRVLVDGSMAYPGEITFCRRHQSLSALFQGLLVDEQGNVCLVLEDIDTDGDGIPDDQVLTLDLECLQPEEIELILDTMGAHSYYFFYPNETPGVHTVVVEARIDTQTGVDGPNTSSDDQGAMATLGHGSMGIQIIRLIQTSTGETLELD